MADNNTTFNHLRAFSAFTWGEGHLIATPPQQQRGVVRYRHILQCIVEVSSISEYIIINNCLLEYYCISQRKGDNLSADRQKEQFIHLISSKEHRPADKSVRSQQHHSQVQSLPIVTPFFASCHNRSVPAARWTSILSDTPFICTSFPTWICCAPFATPARHPILTPRKPQQRLRNSPSYLSPGCSQCRHDALPDADSVCRHQQRHRPERRAAPGFPQTLVSPRPDEQLRLYHGRGGGAPAPGTSYNSSWAIGDRQLTVCPGRYLPLRTRAPAGSPRDLRQPRLGCRY